MNRNVIILPSLAAGLCLAAYAQGAAPPAKVGIINIQYAIASTKDGQKAVNELQTRFNPKKADIEKKNNDIAQAEDQLRKGSNTMSEDARQRLMRDIDQKKKSLTRDTQDAQDEFDQENQKVMQDLGGKIVAVIDKYARERGFTLILDVSSQTTPVLFAAPEIDVTQDIIALYDKNAPAAPAGGTPAAQTPGPAATPPATSRPSATPTGRPAPGTSSRPAQPTTPAAPAKKP